MRVSQEVGDCGMLGQPMLPVLLSVSSVVGVASSNGTGDSIGSTNRLDYYI
jgi:hypothetical protein